MDDAQLEKQYGKVRVQRMQRSKRIQQILVLVSMVSFAGSTVFGLGKLFSRPPAQQQPANVAVAQESELAAKERGYELVLKREPENQTALEGLVNVRLEMKNGKGAIEPLEKLVKLNPDRADYKALLGQAKSQGEGKK
ncbi:tetratricopeptide repeat protein [Microcoleus sp. S28C3]|uniref:tetratricopeptide repeat protein n=1 Tax=Microcoleus sp. S28C3 TaxID=3055414 RepID=UPI002FD12D56